eukprot:TRINITY_DN2134_c0_g1_i1.p2 TRINITY_DN2134_c0_g1~~TRINITY_DN2134_c0_g1_i1.p2  ORF type:complete len:125 (-),score=42.08 TRINITY_DN2134_c0_g1_i1:91-465(-)
MSLVHLFDSWAVWPVTDLKETPADFQVVMELPGVRKEDVVIDLQPEGVLSIKGKKEQEKPEEGKGKEKWHRVERHFGTFERSFTVPKGVDGSKITAAFESGVLRVTIPKPPQPPQPQPLKIIIQ